MKKIYPQSPLESIGKLYSSRFERENCGFGMIVNLDNEASHELVQTAIYSLTRMTHRGGLAADGCSGDGCGLLLAKPDAFFRDCALGAGLNLADRYAAGIVFLHQDEGVAACERSRMETELRYRGLLPSGWIKVPVNTEMLRGQALATLPRIEYLLVNAPDGMSEEIFNRCLFVARRFAEMRHHEDEYFYVVSLHSRTIGYKGLVVPSDLPRFYLDLNNPTLKSSVCSYHQRFSTNTLPQWRLAQPFRFLAHNGELNTIQANRNWANARRYQFQSRHLPELAHMDPLVSMTLSDSASLDNMLEVMVMGGSDILRSLRLLIPPAWEQVDTFDDRVKSFFRFHGMNMEPWDGPAGLVIHDGRYAVCALDRNGLRPTRYVITADRNITFASEIGVFDYDPASVVQKGRVRAGQLVAVDLQAGRLLEAGEINEQLAAAEDYAGWLRGHVTTVVPKMEALPGLSREASEVAQKYFQVTFEERDQVIRVLAEEGQESTASMGDDAPLPVLSDQPRSVYDYFRQEFAQVTNPPIDPLREKIVMSLATVLGREGSVFRTGAENQQERSKRFELSTPVLSPSVYNQLLQMAGDHCGIAPLSLHYVEHIGLENAIHGLCDVAEAAASDGNTLLVLTDESVREDHLTIHAALATGAIHHRLISKRLRLQVNIIVATGTARDPHHFAVLIGYGATAVYPWLAFESIRDMQLNRELSGGLHDYICRYVQGIDKGLLKIMSKIGISTVASYRGAQLFEAVGLADEVIDLCFRGTVSRIQGARFSHLEHDQRQLRKRAFSRRKTIDQGGLLKYVHGGESHAFNPQVVDTLRKAVQTNDSDTYRRFAALVNGRSPMVLRDLLNIHGDGRKPIAVKEVESVEAIVKRFDTAGISLGALSPEAHEALAIAMNRLGGRSNSGEGGEDPKRYGTEKTSKIKQVASGRFGVTPYYLVNAEVLQIKIAQGAKPGEGGQLPGKKVDAYIGMLRCASPGTTLISPPPHHDIYSIEDLAQLIYDLKQVNPQVLVSVKLVAAPGVGTVAAGVAKAYADLITISGYDGGTGASPLTSVKYAGSPFEIGLAETHQVLRANDLRSMVRIQADGGLKTGLDVVKAAMLGAESFGFGTAPMICLGCKYLRICHLNTCAVGVATQNVRLRKEHFIGLPEMVMNYFRFVAEEVRELLAALGIRTMQEIIGQIQYLEPKSGLSGKKQDVDLSAILQVHEGLLGKPHYCQQPSNPPWDKGLKAEKMLATILPAIVSKTGGEYAFSVKNTDRSIGARIAGEIVRRWGPDGMKDAPIRINLTGVAGQSFGAWNCHGLDMRLCGDANDYVGKGMAGGRLVICPPPAGGGSFDPSHAPIVGNTCLYGATGGVFYAQGRSGERFAVRNSGALAVVEGVGDHGCEYMTGGEVVILGSTGLNFGAGMSGGCAFVYDAHQLFSGRFNPELIDVHRLGAVETESYAHRLFAVLCDYYDETQSSRAAMLMRDFPSALQAFWLVTPKNVDLLQLRDTISHRAA